MRFLSHLYFKEETFCDFITFSHYLFCRKNPDNIVVFCAEGFPVPSAILQLRGKTLLAIL